MFITRSIVYKGRNAAFHIDTDASIKHEREHKRIQDYHGTLQRYNQSSEMCTPKTNKQHTQPTPHTTVDLDLTHHSR